MAGMRDDILRIIANLIRFGTVSSVDYDAERIRVQLDDDDTDFPSVTAPIKWATPRAGDTAVWNPPSVGEQVVVLSPNGDLAAGFAIPAIFCSALPKPSGASKDNCMIVFGDGCALLYDHAQHLLRGTLPEGGKVEFTAPAGFKFTGDMELDGALHVTKAITADDTLHVDKAVTAGDTIKATGDISSDADVSAGAISLKHHTTTGVQPGSGISGPPQ
jgi:phage baseplate assembly protein V